MLNTLFDVYLWPFQWASPFWQICALSVPTAVLALIVFRYTSNQAAIKATKDKIKAYLLELRLYRDDLHVLLRAEGQVFRYVLRYMRLAIVPMMVMLIPIGLILIQTEARFAFRALSPDESAIVSAVAESNDPVSQMSSAIELPDGLALETPSLRIDATNEIFWRVRGERSGEYWARITLGEQTIERRVIVGEESAQRWPDNYRADDWRSLFYPGEPPLASGAPIREVRVSYPRARGHFAGLSSASWILFGLSLLFGLVFRPFLGVTF